MENSKFMKANAQAKETAERSMKMFKELDATKKKITAIIQNKWQPLPNISTPKEIFMNAIQDEDSDVIQTLKVDI